MRAHYPTQKKTSPNEVYPETAWLRWRGPLEVLVGILALVPIVLFLFVSRGRLRYPFLLEQLEGPMLLAAERVAHGLPIYARPNFTFIPYMYAPAYYYVSGWGVRLLASSQFSGFGALRLVSLLSTCGSFLFIYISVFLDGLGTRKRRHLAALAGVGVYAAMYPWTREWFDLARVDSFYIFLLLIALLCTRRLHPVFAALAWTLVFLAKQTILPVALVMLCWDWKRPRRLLLGAGSFLLMVAVATRLLDHATRGWFWFYAFTVPHANTDLLLRPAIFFLPSQVFAPFGIALLIVAMAWNRAQPSLHSAGTRFYLLAGASTFALSWFLQAHGGATANTPMPLYAVLAIIFGISFARLDASLAAQSCREPARVLLLAAVGMQLVSWVYHPVPLIPDSGLVAAHENFVSWLRTFPGDVLVTANPYEAVLAGKPWHPDTAALHDTLRPEDAQIRQPVLAEIRANIDQEKLAAIVLDGTPAQALPNQTWLPPDLQSHYPVVGLVPGSEFGDPFAPHPTYFLLPCREQAWAVAKGWTLLRPGGKLPCPR